MARYHVLIVDDHREIRVTYRTNLEVLNEDLKVIDVPSGEEALLEAKLNPIDVLVSDIKLAGISGLELLDKIKAFNPDVKVILVTGLVDVEIRREVARLNAEAFFLKPIDVEEFQNTVLRLLGLKEGLISDKNIPGQQTEELPFGLPERIDHLCQVLDAYAVMLVDDRGKIAARSGSFPDDTDVSEIVPDLLATFGVIRKISSRLGKKNPEDLWYFSGSQYDLYWGHVGSRYGILVAAKPFRDDYGVARNLRVILEAEWGMEWMLEDQRPAVEGAQPDDHHRREKPGNENLQEDNELLMGIIQKSQGVSQDSVDEFWDQAEGENINLSHKNQDVISFEKARELGLTPDRGD
jgi:CheY-like chemotaxis protein